MKHIMKSAALLFVLQTRRHKPVGSGAHRHCLQPHIIEGPSPKADLGAHVLQCVCGMQNIKLRVNLGEGSKDSS